MTKLLPVRISSGVTLHWGSNFYEQVGKDLRKELPDVKSFSARNLRYMHQFYCLFPILQQVVAKLDFKLLLEDMWVGRSFNFHLRYGPD